MAVIAGADTVVPEPFVAPDTSSPDAAATPENSPTHAPSAAFAEVIVTLIVVVPDPPLECNPYQTSRSPTDAFPPPEPLHPRHPTTRNRRDRRNRPARSRRRQRQHQRITSRHIRRQRHTNRRRIRPIIRRRRLHRPNPRPTPTRSTRKHTRNSQPRNRAQSDDTHPGKPPTKATATQPTAFATPPVSASTHNCSPAPASRERAFSPTPTQRGETLSEYPFPTHPPRVHAWGLTASADQGFRPTRNLKPTEEKYKTQ